MLPNNALERAVKTEWAASGRGTASMAVRSIDR
jgi:hypothetical protein